MAARMRGNRGRNRLDATSRAVGGDPLHPASPGLRSQRIRRAHIAPRRPNHLDDPVADRHDGLPVADDHHGRAGAGPLDDGPQHPFLGVGVQVCGGLVEQQHRRRRSERAGQAQPLPLSQRQSDAAAARARCPARPAGRPAPHRIRMQRRRFQDRSARRTGSGCRRRCPGPAPGVAAARTAVATTPSWSSSATSTPADGDPARRRQGEPGDHLQRGGLARAVSAGQHRHPTRFDHRGQIARRRPSRPAHAEVFEADLARRARRPSGCPDRARPWARRSARTPCRRRFYRPGRHGIPRRCGAAARTRPAPAAARSDPVARLISPNTRRRPMLTATSATPSVASNSSTSADRNAIRSVAIAERRWAAASSAMRCSGPAARPSARSVGMPAIRSSSRRLQRRHGRQRGRRSVGGRQPDQHHEDRYQRQRDHHDHRRFQVVERDHGDGGRGQDRGQQQGGQVAGEVGPQAVEPAGDHDRGRIALCGQFTGLHGRSPPPAPDR